MSLKLTTDKELMELALDGLEIKRANVNERIQKLRAEMLGKREPEYGVTMTVVEAKPKRKLSAAARNRIATAQRKRWAKQRRLKKQFEKTATKKRAKV